VTRSTSRPLALASVFSVLSVLTLGECRLFDRLLFQERAEYEFVLSGVSGVLSGRPVSQSWQHRFLSPLLVSAFDCCTIDRLGSLKLFCWLMVGSANVLLFALLRKKGGSVPSCLFGVACFGLGHLLLVYRLEYPWDGLDILLFLSFGYWASQQKPLLSFVPLVVLGTLNHETALFVPLWYLLAPFEKRAPLRQQVRTWLFALAVSVIMAGSIWLLRRHFYVGQPAMAPEVFERPLPVIANHYHVSHNLRQFLVEDWRAGRMFISLSLLLCLLVLSGLILSKMQVRAALWSLCVIASIIVFGYVNETRHYLMLFAFWFGYAWRVEVKREHEHCVLSPPPAP
jgi:hypothetical protein